MPPARVHDAMHDCKQGRPQEGLLQLCCMFICRCVHSRGRTQHPAAVELCLEPPCSQRALPSCGCWAQGEAAAAAARAACCECRVSFCSSSMTKALSPITASVSAAAGAVVGMHLCNAFDGTTLSFGAVAWFPDVGGPSPPLLRGCNWCASGLHHHARMPGWWPRLLRRAVRGCCVHGWQAALCTRHVSHQGVDLQQHAARCQCTTASLMRQCNQSWGCITCGQASRSWQQDRADFTVSFNE